MLGKTEDARKYGDLALKIRDAFNREFFNKETGLYDGGTQTAMSCALTHGLVPPQERERVLGNLVAMIEKNDGFLDAGILGTKYLIDCLTAGGRADVVYGMATKTTYPSWGRWLDEGATTLWEQWDGGASRNHIMFGHISAWFYQVLGGIMPDPEAVGFKHFTIKPQLLGDVTWVAGRARIHVRHDPQQLGDPGRQVHPEDRGAREHHGDRVRPQRQEKAITEGPDYIHTGDHAKFLRVEDAYVVFEVESGTYEFISQLPAQAGEVILTE